MRRRARALPFIGALVAGLVASAGARGGEFDSRGEYLPDPEAVHYDGFDVEPQRYVPDDTEAQCKLPMFTRGDQPSALDGTSDITVDTVSGCSERIVVDLPPTRDSYRTTVWMRHGGVDATLIVQYTPDSGLGQAQATLAPTGRTTSDGWVELASNELPVDGPSMERAFLRLTTFSHVAGVELDALEITRAGEFVEQRPCKGVGDPVCDAEEELCVANACRLGRTRVPPLPPDALRNEVVDMIESRLRVFYGGQRSREIYLPAALAEMELMRKATTAWQFWRHWVKGMHLLHDWHTHPSLRGFGGSSHRLNACFFEGDADLSHAAWPKDATYPDILVSHAGADGAAGLKAGDRLVAVDGIHPLPWAASLAGVNVGFHAATDPSNFADYAEELGGFTGLILRFATELTVIRCDAAAGTCNGLPETLQVVDLPGGGDSPDVACDNRPFYHYDAPNNPDPTNHYVFDTFFRGRVADTTDEEAIFGMTWDTLYGGGDPNGGVNKAISDAIADWKASARGVILDHRAGNGGTLDAPEGLTKLVRPEQPHAVTRMPMEIGGFDGPSDAAEGLAIFQKFKGKSPYTVGSDDHDPALPVALILHRDGSASDYLPYGMKGAPKVRLFGPHATAGAFSTYVEMFYWGGMSFQFASGDTIGFDGQALIGHGVIPDEVILPKQSDLLAGKDTLHEAALAWVRQELKP